MKTLRWGIMGLGNIANKFVENCRAAEGAELVACGSRTAEKSEEFGAKHNIRKRHASYEALAADPEVDIIYIDTPHNFHLENMLLCFEHGKHVLCEKPFTLNAEHSRIAFEKARDKKLFVMEAMWTRFLPSAFKVRELIAQKAIGDVTGAFVSFGFDIGENAGTTSRIVSEHLAGGAVLDVGIYVSSYASMIFGGERPRNVAALSVPYAPTGVDGQTSFVLDYGENRLATLMCAIRSSMPDQAVINGTKGNITVPSFWNNGPVTLSCGDTKTTWNFRTKSTGFTDEIEHTMERIRAGQTDSDIMPQAETQLLMETLDRVRACIGLKYPQEM